MTDVLTSRLNLDADVVAVKEALLATYQPGWRMSMGKITHQNAFFLVLDGALTVTYRESTQTLHRGDFFIRNAGSIAVFRNLSDAPLSYYCVTFQLADDVGVDSLGMPTVFHPEVTEKLEETFARLRIEMQTRGVAYQIKLKALFYTLLSMVLRSYTFETDLSSADVKLLDVIQYIHRSIDRPISVSTLATLAGYSVSHLRNLFYRHLGISPLDYIRRVRIERARQLFAVELLSISDVAARCGFDSISYFSETFRKYVGVTPREYRDKFCGKP